jgi:hypothetical protein
MVLSIQERTIMKFHADLNYFQNIRTRRHFRRRHVEKKTAYEDLSPDERNWLMDLNMRLKHLEEQYLPVMNAKGAGLQARVRDAADWMRRFSLEIVLTYYLRDDDPEYEGFDDNVLMRVRESGFDYDDPDRDWGFGMTSVNHCHFRERFAGEHHCYLYHTLSDHCDLDWRDLLRIGKIQVDIKTDEHSRFLPVIESIAGSAGVT